MDFPLLDSSMKRKAPIPVLGLSASSRLPCRDIPDRSCHSHRICSCYTIPTPGIHSGIQESLMPAQAEVSHSNPGNPASTAWHGPLWHSLDKFGTAPG